MTGILAGVIAVPQKIRRLSVVIAGTPAVIRWALLAGGGTLAAAAAHAVPFSLGAGLGQTDARLIGAAVGALLLGSFGLLALLLPRRAIPMIATALGFVLAVSLAAAVLVSPEAIPRTVRFGRAALDTLPLVLLTLLVLQAGLETRRTELLSV